MRSCCSCDRNNEKRPKPQKKNNHKSMYVQNVALHTFYNHIFFSLHFFLPEFEMSTQHRGQHHEEKSMRKENAT